MPLRIKEVAALCVSVIELFKQPKSDVAGIACPHCDKNINIKVE